MLQTQMLAESPIVLEGETKYMLLSRHGLTVFPVSQEDLNFTPTFSWTSLDRSSCGFAG